MRVLLDTQIFLWVTADSPRLSREARALLEDVDAIYVSAASIWEIAIKAGLGKIDADPSEMVDAIETSGFMTLPITASHAATVASLASHHNDPFDRILVAQAISEPLHLVSADSMVARYSELIIQV